MGALCSRKKSLAPCTFHMLSLISIFFWVGCSCLERERAALLAFKASFLNQSSAYERLKSRDWCRWWGVRCGNEGQVVGLELVYLGVANKELNINLTSLLRLEGLQFLNLAGYKLGGSFTIKAAESLTLGTLFLLN
ncbi:uncharacterized protein LOC18438276 [Amborella trichopoda]|uniref:Leucine-rich repeat-containing N-terminal plant-type domain-containing protein n=1 Tax=Amborella trichopoda TaxID=13333 RepID=W1PQW7_AMBTC|nr:uncharacterized protein LOC18438276 [Amborella trichopoda]ERN10106.1 hypothetical protein AMTR_s00434p00013550 [Amborella trichopoda]|eukprot:XP_006848525.1 uncharacterized protein LOC18438276 [Amborella trichopoda]